MTNPMSNPMDTAPAPVTQLLDLEVVDACGEARDLKAELRYDPTDPYAVTAVFLTAAGPVRWTFGRDLLVEGLVDPAGDGDIHVWPCTDADGAPVVVLELVSPDGEILVQTPVEPVRALVEQSLTLVAQGAESSLLGVDAAIAAILADAA